MTALRQSLANLTASMEAAEQQLQSKATELQQHQDLVVQQTCNLRQLRKEFEQSAAACRQLQGDADAAVKREAALQAQAGRQQDKLSNAQEQLAGKIHYMSCLSAINPLQATKPARGCFGFMPNV